MASGKHLRTLPINQADRNFSDLFFTLTFDNNIDVYQKSIDILNNQVAYAKSKAKGTFNIVHLFQPIPTIFSQHSLERGGNVLGLDRTKKNLIRT